MRISPPPKSAIFVTSAMLFLPLLAAVTVLSCAQEVSAADNFCSSTAKLMNSACQNDVSDNFLTKRAACVNIGDGTERAECIEEAKTERQEERQLCGAQLRARRDVCRDVGEARYEPSFEPEDFVNPLEIGGSVAANPFFPLNQGLVWVYENEEERVTVTVTDQTKLIEGVTCLTVTDVVEQKDGNKSVEITDDWFAQDVEGNVYYCGELSRNFEEQEDGEAELVDLDGSFKVGRDFAKPGLIMPANPAVGDVNRLEFAIGEAEDIAEFIDLAGTATTPAASCSGTCRVTLDTTPLEPGESENKFYAPDIGFILETKPSGEILELVSFTRP